MRYTRSAPMLSSFSNRTRVRTMAGSIPVGPGQCPGFRTIFPEFRTLGLSLLLRPLISSGISEGAGYVQAAAEPRLTRLVRATPATKSRFMSAPQFDAVGRGADRDSCVH